MRITRRISPQRIAAPSGTLIPVHLRPSVGDPIPDLARYLVRERARVLEELAEADGGGLEGVEVVEVRSGLIGHWGIWVQSFERGDDSLAEDWPEHRFGLTTEFRRR